MDEYRINGLTIKENLLQLAENGNKKFTESLHPGIENITRKDLLPFRMNLVKWLQDF